jgi:hypothetical protein
MIDLVVLLFSVIIGFLGGLYVNRIGGGVGSISAIEPMVRREREMYSQKKREAEILEESLKIAQEEIQKLRNANDVLRGSANKGK